MKKRLFQVFCPIVGLTLLCSCSQVEEQNSEWYHEYTQSEKDTVLKYIQVENDLYAFGLSENEALAKGISPKAYKSLMECMNVVNQMIEDSRAKGIPVQMWRPDENK